MTQAEIDATRRQAILANAPLYPKEACHYCGWKVPRLALWCSSPCAQEYAKERADLDK